MSVAAGSRQHFAPSGEANNLDPQRGFLVDFAMQGGVQRFAEFDPAAGQRIETLRRRPRAPHQQDLAVAKDRRADRKLGMRRLDGGRRAHQSMIRKSMPSGHDPMGGNRFSLATNAQRVCAEIMLERKSKLTRALIISLSSLFL